MPKQQTPVEHMLEIAQRESAKYLKIAEDRSQPVTLRRIAMSNSNLLDAAISHLQRVENINIPPKGTVGPR